MRSIRRAVVALLASLMLLGGVGSAFANPNRAGNSGHFHPHSNPCASDNDHPHCPGKH